MQRDMDLVRQILLAIEANPEEEFDGQPTIMGWPANVVSYHIARLDEARLIKAVGIRPIECPIAWLTIQLTWSGHEFLDAARDETIWMKAKTKLGGAFNTVSLAVLQELLSSLARSTVGLP